MCLPAAPLIAIGAAVATTAVSVIGQINSANKANAAIAAQHKAKQRQNDKSTTAEINDRLRQARREYGRIMVAAGEAGVNTSSTAVTALLNDAAMQASLSNEHSLANHESRREAITAEANSMMVSKPTLLGAGLQIGLAGLGAASNAGVFDKKPPGG